MRTFGIIILVVLLLLLAAAVGWVFYTRARAQRLGLPSPPLTSYIPFYKSEPAPYGPPQPRTGGIVGWVNDRIRGFKNRNARTAVGSYEPSGGRTGRRGFGPLDPDEAWDARVGHEADAYGPGGYYEEQELGLTPHHGNTSYGGSGGGGSSYPMNLAATPGDPPPGFGQEEEPPRGRTRSRSPGGLAPSAAASKNPFDDDADPSNMSMRAVSPRPLDTAAAAADAGAGGSGQREPDSPSERRSVFRENM